MATQPDTVETGGHDAAARSSVPAAARNTAETGEQTLSVLLCYCPVRGPRLERTSSIWAPAN
jgi:hypothetical protein